MLSIILVSMSFLFYGLHTYSSLHTDYRKIMLWHRPSVLSMKYTVPESDISGNYMNRTLYGDVLDLQGNEYTYQLILIFLYFPSLD
jgi:hypothetical protein